MAILKQILSGNRARLEVNLEELFGVDVPNDSQFRQVVGQAIIDKIRDRTEDNIDKDGKRFKNYSSSYSDSIEFKAYGKDQKNPNLKQTGEMLGFMDIIEEKPTKIIIGWRDENAEKAHGHITGNVGVKRDFLGLPSGELQKIANEFQSFLGERFATSKEVLEPKEKSSVDRLTKFITGERDIKPKTLGSIIGDLFGESND